MSRYLMTNAKVHPIKENKKIYNEFLKFKKSFFEDGVSFFDNNIKLFDNDDVFNIFEERIIKNYDNSKNKSEDKYIIQLENTSTKMRHFFANIIWLYNYPIHNQTKKAETKTKELKTYLNKDYHESLQNIKITYNGIATWGMLSHQKYENINLIYFFTKEYIKTKKNPNDILNNLILHSLMCNISNNSNFKKISSLASRHILNYLFNPDKYEPIVNTSCKEKIAKHFQKKYTPQTLDDVLLEIRNDEFGFEKSLFTEVCNHKITINNKNIKIIDIVISPPKPYNFSLERKNFEDDDPFKKERIKLENGEEAEILVYNEIKDNVNMIVLSREVNRLFNENKASEIHSNKDDLIHYSKNFNKFSPFDLISTRGEEIIYIEVKSTTSSEIYFSIHEIRFAYQNLDNYEVKVVNNKIIYDLNMSEVIKSIYNETIDNTKKWSFETIKLKIKIGE